MRTLNIVSYTVYALYEHRMPETISEHIQFYALIHEYFMIIIFYKR